MNEEIRKPPSLHLLVIINDLDDADKADHFLQRAGFPLRYRCHGEGTASSEILDLLGLGSSDKGITISIVPKAVIPKLLQTLSAELELYKPGRGIVFTIPLSGASGPVMHYIDPAILEGRAKQMEREVEEMSETIAHSLILATVNQGYSEEVMEAAKAGGATGGTVIHACSLGMEETFKFWGINVQSEKEIIAILVTKEQRLEVMKLIGEKCGMHSEAHGVVFSLPVDTVAGIHQPTL